MLKTEALRGIFPPILTPLTEDEQVDHASLRRLVDFLIAGGVHGIWVTGTTGEFGSFDEKEREAIVRTAVEATAGRVPVIAGIGDASTRLAIRHGLAAQRAGVDGVALLPPYYYSNSADELLDHYRAVRDTVDLPLLVYNIPQNVKVKVEVKTVLTLAQEGTVVGLKDSQNDLDWFRQVMTGARKMGSSLRGFLGTRYLIDAGILVGAHGAIPGISNVAPSLAVGAYEAAARGDWQEAARFQEKLAEVLAVSTLAKGSQASANMSGMKAALKQMGILTTAKVTLPLRTVSEDEEERIREILVKTGLLG